MGLKLENSQLADQLDHPALRLIAARPDIFSRQGHVAASYRRRNGKMFGPYYRLGYRDEGRTLLHAAFQSAARLEVNQGELRVTIAAQSSPHRTAALAALCSQLDAIPTTFPGTRLRLRLNVEPSEPLTS
jgi:hypothetical protein